MLHGPLTLGRILRTRVEKSPEKYAIGWIESGEVKNLTFMDYRNTIEILVNAFHKIGVNVADKVAILAQTCKEWHLLDMATISSRACLVPIYPSYLASDISYIINHSDSSVLIVENEAQLEKVLSELTHWKNIKVIISINELSEETAKKIRNAYPFYSYKDLLRIGADELKSTSDFFENSLNNQLPEEITSIIYTSGTTGEPKGAVITQNGLCTMLMNVEKTIKGAFSSSDKTLVFLPLSHVLGRCDSLLPLVFGWQSVYAESMERLIENIQIVRPTVMIAVPRIFEKIYTKILDQVNQGSPIERQVFKRAVKAAENYFSKIDKDLSPSTTELLEYKLAYKLVFSKIYNRFGGKIRYFVSGGASLSVEIIKFLRYANLTVLEGYGLTETIAPCCLNPLAKQVPGTVGKPMGDVQIKFEADGEILVKSAALMREYYKNPEATSEALKDGWLHTGDIGEFNFEGYLRITDRKKDLMKTSGGKYIAPQKVENLAKAMPHISQIVVIGDKRKFLSAIIGIEKETFFGQLEEIGLSTGSPVSEFAKNEKVLAIIQEEINQVNSHLAQFETIKKFHIVPEEFSIENFLTPSLKVKRKLVSERFAQEIEAMYQ